MDNKIIVKERDLPSVIEQLKGEIASCESIPKLKEIKSQAKAWETYYKTSGFGLEAQNLGAEIKLRSERKMGQLLKEMELQSGARGVGKKVELRDETPLLEDLGISKIQSYRYRKLLKISDKEFDEFFLELRAKFQEITTFGLLKILKGTEREERKRKYEQDAINYKEQDDIKIIHGDFRKVDIKDNSIDLILTDPPYPKEYLPLWEDLFEVSARILKPSGFLVAYSGQMYLDKIFQMKNELLYYWTMSIEFTKKPIIMGRNVINAWKPILVFQKPPFKKLKKVPMDRLKFDYTERDLHNEDWGQTVEPFEYLLEHFSELGDTVFEPFAGTGTTLIACKNKKRKCIGSEIEESYINLIKGRLCSKK